MIQNTFSNYLGAPQVQASGLTVSELSDTQLRLTWTRGNGREVLIVGKLGSEPIVAPIGNTTYAANSIFGSGNEIVHENFVLYKGTGTTVLVTGLADTTIYDFYAYEFNYIEDGTEKYNRIGATVETTTLVPQVAPTVQATDLVFVGDRELSWTAGNGSHKLVLAKLGSAVNATPTDNVEYVADSVFGDGDELGTGNFVVYNGVENFCYINDLAYSSNYHFRVFEYNVASGNEKYQTATATGNPLSHNTIAEEVWYLHHGSVAISPRYTEHPEDTSRSCSKFYSGGACETSTEYLLFLVGDNNSGPSIDYHFDQTFLAYKSKADGLPFTEGWTMYADINGEPIAVLTTGYAEFNGSSIQNWLANPTVLADNNIVAYYSWNVGTSSSRYSVGKAVSTDGGRTWSRTATNITATGGGEDHYQFQQAYYDTALTKWVLISPNARSGTEGRWCSTRIYTSTDGATGLTFTKISNDIYFGTQVDVAGFALQGPMWKDGSRYHWYATETSIPAYLSTPETNPTQVTYQWLQKRIIEVSADVTDLTTAAIPDIRIERRLYETDQQAVTSIYPSSLKFTHGGLDHIFVSCFLWRAEDGNQITADVRVLSNGIIADGKSQVIGRDLYPNYIFRFYKMHQTHLSDVYQSTTTYPIEVITNTNLTLGGAGTDPQQYNMNSVIVGTKYPQGASFTHNQEYLAVKMVASSQLIPGGTTERGIVEKAGTFKMIFHNENFFEVWLYGTGGGIKKYRATSTNGIYKHALWGPAYNSRFGFTARLNAGGTDIDLKLNIDYSMDITVTKVQDDVFTEIAQTTDVITFGHTTADTNHNDFIGSCIIMSGDDEATQTNWLNENNI